MSRKSRKSDYRIIALLRYRSIFSEIVTPGSPELTGPELAKLRISGQKRRKDKTRFLMISEIWKWAENIKNHKKSKIGLSYYCIIALSQQIFWNCDSPISGGPRIRASKKSIIISRLSKSRPTTWAFWWAEKLSILATSFCCNTFQSGVRDIRPLMSRKWSGLAEGFWCNTLQRRVRDSGLPQRSLHCFIYTN